MDSDCDLSLIYCFEINRPFESDDIDSMMDILIHDFKIEGYLINSIVCTDNIVEFVVSENIDYVENVAVQVFYESPLLKGKKMDRYEIESYCSRYDIVPKRFSIQINDIIFRFVIKSIVGL